MIEWLLRTVPLLNRDHVWSERDCQIATIYFVLLVVGVYVFFTSLLPSTKNFVVSFQEKRQIISALESKSRVPLEYVAVENASIEPGEKKKKNKDPKHIKNEKLLKSLSNIPPTEGIALPTPKLPEVSKRIKETSSSSHSTPAKLPKAITTSKNSNDNISSKLTQNLATSRSSSIATTVLSDSVSLRAEQDREYAACLQQDIQQQEVSNTSSNFDPILLYLMVYLDAGKDGTTTSRIVAKSVW